MPYNAETAVVKREFSLDVSPFYACRHNQHLRCDKLRRR